MKKGMRIWCLIVVLTVVWSAFSGMAGAADKSANLTGDAPDGIVNNTLPNEIREIKNTNATANKTIKPMWGGWPDLEVTNKTLEPTEIEQGKSGLLNLTISEVRGHDWAKDTWVYVEILNPDGCYFLESGNNLTSTYLDRIDREGSKQASFNLSVLSNATFGNRTIKITVKYWETGLLDIGTYGPYYEYAYINFTVLTVEEELLDEGNTTIPYMVYLVLHDPSGDGSYSYIEEDQEFTIGAELDLGTSKTVKEENYVDLWVVSFGASEQVTTDKTKTEGVEMTFKTTKRIETPKTDEASIIGPGYGDVFFGEEWVLHYQLVNRTTWMSDDSNPYYQLIDAENVFQYWVTRGAEFVKTASYFDNYVEEPWRSRVLGLDLGLDNVVNTTEEEKLDDFGAIEISGGPPYTRTDTTTLTKSSEFQFTMNIAKTTAESFGFKYYGAEFGHKVTVTSSFFIGSTEYTDMSQSVEIGYVLNDDDAFPVTDVISMHRYYDKVFGTYLFVTDPDTSYTSSPREPWTKSSVAVTPELGVAGTLFIVNVSMDKNLQEASAQIQYPDECVIGDLDLYDDGAHNDGAVGDGIYGNTWDSTGALLGTYYVDIIAIDQFGNRGESDNVAFLNVVATPSELTTITVSPSTASLYVGDIQTFTATAYDQNGNTMSGVTLSWTSTSTSVGTVSLTTATTGADGTATTTFTAVAAGTTSVTATYGSVSGTAVVTVSAETPVLTSITVSPSTASLTVSGTQQFTATAYDQNYNTMSGVAITWSTTPTGIGTVSPSSGTTGTAGTATTTFAGVAAGTTAVQATSGSVSDYSVVTVTSTSAITATRDISAQTVALGDTFTVTVTTTPNQDVTALTLDEDLPSGWTVTEVDSAGATFKSSTTEWLWMASVSSGTTKTVIYSVTVPSDATYGDYAITGSVSAYGVAATAVGGESTVTVTTDWNPWDDDGVITTEEIQEALNCWLTDTPINGHTVTTAEIQELVNMWLTS